MKTLTKDQYLKLESALHLYLKQAKNNDVPDCRENMFRAEGTVDILRILGMIDDRFYHQMNEWISKEFRK